MTNPSLNPNNLKFLNMKNIKVDVFSIEFITAEISNLDINLLNEKLEK